MANNEMKVKVYTLDSAEPSIAYECDAPYRVTITVGGEEFVLSSPIDGRKGLCVRVVEGALSIEPISDNRLQLREVRPS